MMNISEYLKTTALSRSDLSALLRSPAHFKARREAPPAPPTDQMRLGSLVHCMLLEPDDLDKRYVVSQKFDRRTKIGKEGFADFSKAYAGFEIVDQEVQDTALAMVAEVKGHPAAADIIAAEGLREYSVKFNYNARELKCRPDIWHRDAKVVTDIKTCRDASQESFSRDIYVRDYDLQAALYLTGTMATDFIFICVENEPPYGVAVYRCNEDVLKSGMHKLNRALEILERCESTNNWRAYPDEITEIGIPRWARRNGNE